MDTYEEFEIFSLNFKKKFKFGKFRVQRESKISIKKIRRNMKKKKTK
jgi:hypothetical protein